MASVDFQPRRPPRPTAGFEAELRERHGDVLFSDDGATIDEVVAGLLSGADDRDRRVLHRRPDGGAPDRPGGSSAYVLGGVVVYSNGPSPRSPTFRPP